MRVFRFLSIVALAATVMGLTWMAHVRFSPPPAVRNVIYGGHHPPNKFGVPHHDSDEHSRMLLFRTGDMNTEREIAVDGWTQSYSLHNAARTVSDFVGAPFYSQYDSNADVDIVSTWVVQVSLSMLARGDHIEVIEDALGTKLHGYLPHNAFKLHASKGVALKAANIEGVEWVGPLPPHTKVLNELIYVISEEKPLALDAELLVLLNKDVLDEMKPAERLSSLWSNDLSHFGVSLSASASHIIVVEYVGKLPISELHEVVDFFIQMHSVRGVDIRHKHKTLNEIAQWITQSGSPNRRPIWDKSIRGQGELIACADTGLDFDHCMFRDTDIQRDEFGVSHRKINNYITSFGDKTDDPDGHGTHVVGSIVGNAYAPDAPSAASDIEDHSGTAPEATVYFQDIETHGDRSLTPPDDLFDLFYPPYTAGARVHSNSWGASSNTYSSMAADLDAFVHDSNTDDMVILFAAGNDGQDPNSISGSVGTPATAKNALVIGASQTTNAGWLDSLNYIDFEARRLYAIEVLEEDSNFDCCDGSREVKQYCCKQFLENNIANDAEHHDFDSVADFSSRGPAFDGRVKPDLMAPGQYIVSARSGGDSTTDNCGIPQNALLSNAGTSMATPVAAGTAALVRQYYREGWYPTGEKVGANAMSAPSAALIIATLVNGAIPLEGDIDLKNNGKWIPVGDVYPSNNIFQGFGLINLENSLYFKDESSFSLFVRDRISISAGGSKTFCFSPTASGTIKVSLVYSDYEAATGASMATVNNIDIYAGRDAESAIAGNFKRKRDARNNVEIIIFEDAIAGEDFIVRIEGVKVPRGPQNVALVVRGKFDVSSVSEDSCTLGVTSKDFSVASDSDHFPYTEVVGGGIGAAVVLLVIVAICVFAYYRRKKMKQAQLANQQRLQQQGGVPMSSTGQPQQPPYAGQPQYAGQTQPAGQQQYAGQPHYAGQTPSYPGQPQPNYGQHPQQPAYGQPQQPTYASDPYAQQRQPQRP